jgi:hypothetical protein
VFDISPLLLALYLQKAACPLSQCRETALHFSTSDFLFSAAILPLLQYLLIINGLRVAAVWQYGSKSRF